MKRILVIGSCGAGKSTFSRLLHEAAGLKLVHLDKLYWKPNWVEPAKDEWRKTVEKTLQGDGWILDGNYGGTLALRLEKCDTVIFLDFPRTVCNWRVIKRVLLYRQGSRPDMAEGCAEKFDWEFVKWTWNYPKRSKPRVEELPERFKDEKKIIRLESKAEVESFFINYSQTSVLKSV
ncbi:MAG: DNA topology modulation protein [Pyrinomonadaceae bacterium]|nr:DNA topology modulation protein [Pyrinomonadaceae bacterium]